MKCLMFILVAIIALVAADHEKHKYVETKYFIVKMAGKSPNFFITNKDNHRHRHNVTSNGTMHLRMDMLREENTNKNVHWQQMGDALKIKVRDLIFPRVNDTGTVVKAISYICNKCDVQQGKGKSYFTGVIEIYLFDEAGEYNLSGIFVNVTQGSFKFNIDVARWDFDNSQNKIFWDVFLKLEDDPDDQDEDEHHEEDEHHHEEDEHHEKEEDEHHEKEEDEHHHKEEEEEDDHHHHEFEQQIQVDGLYKTSDYRQRVLADKNYGNFTFFFPEVAYIDDNLTDINVDFRGDYVVFEFPNFQGKTLRYDPSIFLNYEPKLSDWKWSWTNSFNIYHSNKNPEFLIYDKSCTDCEALHIVVNDLYESNTDKTGNWQNWNVQYQSELKTYICNNSIAVDIQQVTYFCPICQLSQNVWFTGAIEVQLYNISGECEINNQTLEIKDGTVKINLWIQDWSFAHDLNDLIWTMKIETQSQKSKALRSGKAKSYGNYTIDFPNQGFVYNLGNPVKIIDVNVEEQGDNNVQFTFKNYDNGYLWYDPSITINKDDNASLLSFMFVLLLFFI